MNSQNSATTCIELNTSPERKLSCMKNECFTPLNWLHKKASNISKKSNLWTYMLILTMTLLFNTSSLLGQEMKFDQNSFLPKKMEMAKTMKSGQQLELTKAEVFYIDNNLKGISAEIESVKKDLKKAKLFQDTEQASILEKKLVMLRKMFKDYDFVKTKSLKEL